MNDGKQLLTTIDGVRFIDTTDTCSNEDFTTLLKRISGSKILITDELSAEIDWMMLAQEIENNDVIHLLHTQILDTNFSQSLKEVGYEYVSDYSRRGLSAAVEAALRIAEPEDCVIYYGQTKKNGSIPEKLVSNTFKETVDNLKG